MPCAKLARVSERVGVGPSLKLLREEGDFDPGSLVAGLDESFGERPPNVAGFHVFTFNDLEGTESWRQQALAGLPA